MTTFRVSIEPLRPDHADLLFEPLGDGRIYLHLEDEPPASLDALRHRYRALAAGAPPDSGEVWLNWLVRLRADGQPLGTVQATVRPRPEPSLVAWVVLPPVWGRGYGTEAVAQMLDELASGHGVELVRAEIDEGNLRSIALATRLGFEPIGRIPLEHSVELVYQRSLGPEDQRSIRRSSAR